VGKGLRLKVSAPRGTICRWLQCSPSTRSRTQNDKGEKKNAAKRGRDKESGGGKEERDECFTRSNKGKSPFLKVAKRKSRIGTIHRGTRTLKERLWGSERGGVPKISDK